MSTLCFLCSDQRTSPSPFSPGSKIHRCSCHVWRKTHSSTLQAKEPFEGFLTVKITLVSRVFHRVQVWSLHVSHILVLEKQDINGPNVWSVEECVFCRQQSGTEGKLVSLLKIIFVQLCNESTPLSEESKIMWSLETWNRHKIASWCSEVIYELFMKCKQDWSCTLSILKYSSFTEPLAPAAR